MITSQEYIVQKATITNVHFYDWSRCATGTVLSHPGEGTRSIYIGGPITTSPIVRRYKNGNFRTLNTHYTVVPVMYPAPACPDCGMPMIMEGNVGDGNGCDCYGPRMI